MIAIFIGSIFSFLVGIVLVIFATLSLEKERVSQKKSKAGRALCFFAVIFIFTGIAGMFLIYANAATSSKTINNYQLVMVDEVFQNGISIVDPTVNNDIPQIVLCTSDGIEKGDFVDTNGKLILSGKAAVMEYCNIKEISYGLLTANP